MTTVVYHSANFWTFSTLGFPGIRLFGCFSGGATIFWDGVSLRGAVGWRGFSCSGASLYWSEVKNAL